MPQVVVVGAGFYGLIAAKTYLQVTGAYNNTTSKKNSNSESSNDEHDLVDDVLVIDSASDIGGTWAQERLYPNLLSQNSYGHYEFSDLSLKEAVPDDPSGCRQDEKIFIPGWKINRYLHIWSDKWDLKRRIRLNWKITRITRLPTKEWTLDIIETKSFTSLTVTCDKLILATGLTSDPNVPDVPVTGDRPVPAVHAKDLGKYCREKLGYRPFPRKTYLEDKKKTSPAPRSVAVYGGAKSAFDFVHLFGSLHHNSESFRLETQTSEPVQVHWIIREDGHGPAFMTRPTTQLGMKTVPSDQAVCTRLMTMISTCVNRIPKRIVWPYECSMPRVEGSWARRLFHGNPFGRALIRRLWKGVDDDIANFANYDSQPKMQKLRPQQSVIECTAPGGIANHDDLWETIRSPNVHIYRSTDLIVHATGWKSSFPIPFDPPELGAQLGLPGTSNSTTEHAWAALEQSAESRLRSCFPPEVFKHEKPQTSNTYRLFRRLASPALVAEGDRSFAVLGAVYIGAAAMVAEVQALWTAAFLTGGLDEEDHGPLADCKAMYESVANDAVWGRLTGLGLNIETHRYNDQLMRDLGLNPYREGGWWWWKELMAVYGPRSYAGIVEEWMALRGSKIRES